MFGCLSGFMSCALTFSSRSGSARSARCPGRAARSRRPLSSGRPCRAPSAGRARWSGSACRTGWSLRAGDAGRAGGTLWRPGDLLLATGALVPASQLEVPLRRKVAVQLDATDELARGSLLRPALRGGLTRAGDGTEEAESNDDSYGKSPLWPQQPPSTHVRATWRPPFSPRERCAQPRDLGHKN